LKKPKEGEKRWGATSSDTSLTKSEKRDNDSGGLITGGVGTHHCREGRWKEEEVGMVELRKQAGGRKSDQGA